MVIWDGLFIEIVGGCMANPLHATLKLVYDCDCVPILSCTWIVERH